MVLGSSMHGLCHVTQNSGHFEKGYISQIFLLFWGLETPQGGRLKLV